jgi:tRNA(Ile)-lysidine synthase
MADWETGDARQTAAVEAAVRAAIERDHLLPAAGRVVVAVSGGADSLCLLGVLHALCGPGRVWPEIALIVAHLDHGLRGAAGQADAAWVAAHSAALGLPCRLGTADVSARARGTGRGIEAAARQARYAFLREIARTEDAARICAGHTRDDQAETLVMRWLRGSGLSGLVGMRPLAGDVARPLLDLTHQQTTAYCAARGWEPRVDPTNADRRYRRNRIRHDLLPLLEQYNPNLTATLTRNARLLADDEDYLAARALEAWDAAVRETSQEQVGFDVAALAELPAALRRRVLRRAAALLAGGDPALDARHVAALDDLLARPGGGRSIHLPAGLVAAVEAGALVVARPAPAVAAPKLEAPLPLPVPGCVAVPGTGWRVRAALLDASAGSPPPGIEDLRDGDAGAAHEETRPTDGPAAAVRATQLRAYLDADAAGSPLYVRTWRAGDRFRPLGMTGEKKLHDYFVDAKVPRAERGRIPLVWGPRHLLWVAGHRVDDRARLSPSTRRVLALRLEPDRSPDRLHAEAAKEPG